MDIIIVTRFHHGGKFVEASGGGLTYIGKSEVEYVGIDKDHFSLMELLFYTRDLRYVTVGGFYFKDPTSNNFVLVDNDFSLLNLIKDLGDGDFLDLYVRHVIDEVEIIKDGVPTGYLCGPTVGEIINEDGVENSHNINVDEGLQQGAAQSENISVEVGVDEGLQQGATQSENINVEVGVDDASDLEGVETDWDINDDSQEFAIPDDDDSEIDEELRTLRNERRTKLQRKKPDSTEEIILGVAGIDRGFEDIGRNKAARYVGRLGGDEQYIDSSELDSDDSRDELDPEAVEGVDLPARRKSKKVRFDPDCVVAIFELGMGACKGELLVAIGRNGNQQMFPIAWAVVDQETKHSWRFFINFLIQDLNLGTGHGLTVMSNMQKGLVAAIMELLPDCEQMMCARHIWSNWQKNWRGEERRKQFWRCAKSSFEVKFQDEMDKLDKLGNKICGDLLHYEKKTWCKAYFKEHAKCDVVENNMCETFNSWILAARHKSIITMLEEIRHKIMDRNVEMRKFVDTWILDISPMASLVLEENKDYARNCQVRFNGQFGYEILDGRHRHIIDIRKKTCTCRTWQLRGIPCQHAVLAYQHAGQDPEDHVVYWYRKDTFMKTYNYFIQPIPNMKMWPHTSDIVIEPLEPKQMPGKPPKCRRKSKDEPRKKRVQQAGKGRGRGRGKSRGRGSDDTSTVTKGQQAGRGKGREGASTSTRGNKRPKTVGFGIYTDDLSGRQTLNPGTTGERVVTLAVFKCATPTNIDIGYKPRGLKWKGKDAVTTPQLQRMTLTPHRQNTFASEEVEIDKLDISFAVKKTNEEFFFISTVAATMVRCGEERDEK
ncbi:hypothetical protein MTR67_010064 [Solanum verrucosum]|uniref:SWIM-type domain-containing protein n=1 Tax=Solanum verrucosum TaxID=315347 RepID=A0AAF0Q4D0_SOLVR|nr:hypothetical protein MTR67_010064 [Solanum verrucosum]